MGRALAVHHGGFGRATVYHLDRSMITHAHREGHLIFHVDGERGRVVVDGEPVPLTPESAAAVNPWAPHSFEVSDMEHGSLFLVLYIKPFWFLEFGRSGAAGLRFGRDTVFINARIRRSVEKAAMYLLSRENSDRFEGLLYELTRECFEQSWQWAPEAAPIRDACNAFNDFRVRKSLQLMQENFTEDLEIDEVARGVGLSRPHFFRLFKKQMGLTPNLYVNTLRMECAITQLTRTGKSITEISEDLCFSSQASFSRFFAANSGISPSNYRQVAQVEIQ